MASLVPRPFLTAFFAAVAKSAFATAAKKAVREGLGTRLNDGYMRFALVRLAGCHILACCVLSVLGWRAPIYRL